ncbi:T9SS type A sorting domain-containing protein [Bizionia gelidisalsuginis]|uniref:T9SS type A sorting domain-containing protein n=1 Tax=Bizionia gelidisalsuginis TaxID=291188 RepID=A0ABY3MB88_9FLAO|nr:T9SS type A sorting domain-containing protein [Bizionia gelidisalsuginis]TYC13558.1 T9SS type A sorting domain-containing protein [Bizionia gelidisalsuginis]
MKFKTLITTLLITINCFTQSLDTSFSDDGKLLLENIGVFKETIVQDDGKVLFTGKNEENYGTVFRLNTDGTYDHTFGTQGKLILTTTGNLTRPHINSDGSYFIYDGNNHLIKLFNDGTVDNSFNNTSFGGQDYVVLSTGKIVAIDSKHTLKRYNSDGTIDSSYGTNGILTVFSQGQKIVRIEVNPATDDIYILDSGSSNANYKVWKLFSDNTLNNSPFIQGSFVWTTDFRFYDNKLYLSGHKSPSLNSRLTKLGIDDLNVLQLTSVDRNDFIPRNKLSFQENGTAVQLLRHYVDQYNYNIKINLFDNDYSNTNLITANFPEIEYFDDGFIASDNFLNKIYFVSGGYNNIFIARFNYSTLSINESEMNKIKIWPNPIENIVNFSTDFKTGEIYSIDGKQVLLNIRGTSLDITNLSKGIYILKGIDIYDRNINLKIVRK